MEAVGVVEVEKHPFDFDRLKKGDIIPVERIESLSRVSRDSARYSLIALKYKDQIESELESRGRPVTVKIDRGNLVILTDSEAAEYNKTQFDARKRQMGASHRRAMQVDIGQLSDDQKERHRRNLLVQGAQLAAMRKVVRVEASAHKRITPGAPVKKQDS